MKHAVSRRRAGTESRLQRAVSRHAGRLLATGLLTVAMAAVALVISAVPAQGDTSPRYHRLWDNLSHKNHRWARRVSECESGGYRKAHSPGGTYHGAFQFSSSTWKSSPKSPGGDPHRYSWRTQAVVAIYLKKRDGGRTHWPNCP